MSSEVSASDRMDPRESMRVLPEFAQGLLTRITGKPYEGQPRWAPSPWTLLSKNLIAWVGGMLASVAIWHGLLPLWLLPVPWIAILCGARTLQVQIVHQCAHFNFTRNRQIDEKIGLALSAVLLIPDFSSYKRIHHQHHAQNVLATVDDDTFQFLFGLVGLKPGASMAWQWRKLLFALVSPVYHLRFIGRRLRFIVRPNSLPHALLGGGFILSLVALSALYNAWDTLLIAWVIPNILLYQMSAAIRLCVEHYWPGSAADARTPQDYTALTVAVFLGEPCPVQSDSWWRAAPRWGRWLLRMLFLHLPSRLCVMVGDTPCHDYHHRYPRDPRWTEYMFQRQQEAATLSAPWRAPYHEVWGLIDAINHAFSALEVDKRGKEALREQHS